MFVTPPLCFYVDTICRWTTSSWSSVWRAARTLRSSSSGWTPLFLESHKILKRAPRRLNCYWSSAWKSATSTTMSLSSTQVLQCICVCTVCMSICTCTIVIMQYSLHLVDTILEDPERKGPVPEKQTATQTEWVSNMQKILIQNIKIVVDLSLMPLIHFQYFAEFWISPSIGRAALSEAVWR